MMNYLDCIAQRFDGKIHVIERLFVRPFRTPGAAERAGDAAKVGARFKPTKRGTSIEGAEVIMNNMWDAAKRQDKVWVIKYCEAIYDFLNGEGRTSLISGIGAAANDGDWVKVEDMIIELADWLHAEGDKEYEVIEANAK